MADIKYILCDFWGTVAQIGVYSPVKKIRHTLGLHNVEFGEYVNRMQKVLLGQEYPNMREAFEAVAKEFDVSISEEQLDELVGMWNKSWIMAKPLPYIKETFGRLSDKYTFVLVANTDSKSIENCLDKFGWKDLFARTFYSCDVGAIKTEPAFLEHVLSELGATASECVFLGDGVNSDMKPAEDSGMIGILIDRRDRQEYSPKIRRIEGLGLAIEKLS